MATPNNGINGTLGTGLIGHWSFDNKSYLDSSGNGNTLIPFDDARFIAVPDKDSIANSAIQASTTNYLYNDTVLNEVSNDYNISIWFKGNNSESRGVLAAGVLNAHTFIIAADTPLKMRFFANGAWSAYYSINAEWNNVIIGYNYVSVNGVRTTTTQYIGFSVLTRLYLFRYNSDYYINLPIDELRIYNRNLSLSETTELYEMGVNYTAKCETPIANPVGGTYTEAQSVELTCSTPNSDIYYTLDNSTPTTSSLIYTSSIMIIENKIIKAIAVDTLGVLPNSEVMVEKYRMYPLNIINLEGFYQTKLRNEITGEYVFILGKSEDIATAFGRMKKYNIYGQLKQSQVAVNKKTTLDIGYITEEDKLIVEKWWETKSTIWIEQENKIPILCTFVDTDFALKEEYDSESDNIYYTGTLNFE